MKSYPFRENEPISTKVAVMIWDTDEKISVDMADMR